MPQSCRIRIQLSPYINFLGIPPSQGFPKGLKIPDVCSLTDLVPEDFHSEVFIKRVQITFLSTSDTSNVT